MSQHEGGPDLFSDPGAFVSAFSDDLLALLVLTAGILAYTLIVTRFYKTLSQRVMFAREEEEGTQRSGVAGWLSYVLLFPLISFAFFLLLSGALLFLAEDKPVIEVYTLAMALIAAVRVAAYLSEDASEDLAKLLPLGLLAVFLVRYEFAGVLEAFAQLGKVFESFQILLAYFVIVLVLEFSLRFLRAAWVFATEGTSDGDAERE